MNRLFKELIEKHAPKMNKDMMEGMAVKRVNRLYQYIDQVLRGAQESFPPGLEYVELVKCSPYEGYCEFTRAKNGRRVYDIAESYIYLVKILFRFKGQDMEPKYMALPFCRKGGLLKLSGTDYHISPVISDKAISIGSDTIFVRLIRDKFTFKRQIHWVYANGQSHQTYVVWSQIYRNHNRNKRVPPTTRANTTVIHYLFAKYGMREALRQLLGFEFHVGFDDITTEKYPADKWVIVESSFVHSGLTKPRMYIQTNYTPSRLKIAIPIDRWGSMSVKSILGSLFYVVDSFPNEVTPYMLDDARAWLILLGSIIFSGQFTQANLFQRTSAHFKSLDGYVDDIMLKKFKETGHDIRSFYDLLAVIAINFNDWLVKNQANINSILQKDLEIDYYVGYGITSRIITAVFNLNKCMDRKNGEITYKDVDDILKKNLRIGAVHDLKSENLAVSSVNYCGDNMYPKITAPLAEQTSQPSPRRPGHRRLVANESAHFHTSMVEIGSFLFLPKSNPRSTSRLNPYTKVGIDSAVIVNRLHPEIIEKTQQMFEGKYKGLLAV